MSLRSVRSLRSVTFIGILCSLASAGFSAPQSTSNASGGVSGVSPLDNSDVVSSAVAKARAFAYQNTHDPLSALGKLAVSQMQAFGAAMGVPASQLQNAKVADYGTFVMAVTDNWIYTGDVSGNETLRPVSALPYLVKGFEHPGSLSGGSDIASKITGEARTIVSVLGLKANLKNAYCKKEQVLVARCGTTQQTELYDGRNIVLLGTDDGTFLHLICDSHCTPIRVDTNIQTETTATLSRMLFEQLKAGGTFPLLHDDTDDFTFGTFFSQHWPQFEINASSFESHQLPSVTTDRNPFDGTAQANNSSFFNFWNANGRLGGIRGNWDQTKGTWQRPNINVVHHSMGDYSMIGNVGIDSNTIDSGFHRDLERCTVGVFTSHGGPIHDNYQIDSGKTWFIPGDSHNKYGIGNLRHLIFVTCGAMGFVAETGGAGYKSLLGEWLPAKYVDGLRTACGDDGGSAGLDRDGWRFFNLYNKGDSIEASWSYTSIVECAQNTPVTVAYAATPEEALTILTDGRFSKERSESTYSVANVWREIK